jgi:hypothetical protein
MLRTGVVDHGVSQFVKSGNLDGRPGSFFLGFRGPGEVGSIIYDGLMLERIEGEVWLSPELVRNALREHDMRVPKDIVCACGFQFDCSSFEEGREMWVEHVIEVMTRDEG